MATSNAKSNFSEQKVIEALLKNTTYVGGATLAVGLFISDPGEASGGTEVAEGNYARQNITAASGWSAGGDVGGFYEVSNAADIAFPVATVAYAGNVTHFVLFDGSANRLYYGQLDVPKTVGVGDQFKFLVGTLKISES